MVCRQAGGNPAGVALSQRLRIACCSVRYKGGKVSGKQTLPRSPALKRTQKGREEERTGRGRPAVNGIELRNLCICWILPKVCSHLKATSVIASWRAVIGDPESKAHSRVTSCQQGNQ